MSEEKKNLKDEEIKKTKELSSEELDKVSGGIGGDRWETGYKDWKKDLAESKNPNGFGSTFDEWKQLLAVRKEDERFGKQRCPSCGSWRCSDHSSGGVAMIGCWDCRDIFEPIAPTVKWGAKGRSIYYGTGWM